MPSCLVDAPEVELRADLLAETRVFSNRLDLLQGLAFPTNGIVSEVGTSTGVWAKQMIRLLKPLRLYVVDIDFSRFDRSIEKEVELKMLEGDSIQMISGLPDNHLDFAYIDANHSYLSVKGEIDAIYPKMKAESFLMFNDYVRFSVNQVLPYGVQSAVNEFANATSSTIVGVALSGTGNYDIALKVSKRKTRMSDRQAE